VARRFGHLKCVPLLSLLGVLGPACAATDDGGLGGDPAPASSTTEMGGRPAGFERVAATITAADGTICEVCLWLAETAEQRRGGLMGVTDVGTSDGSADGMAFVYPEPHTGTFWMKNTLLPLSIAFFAESGAYLSSFDMEPCTADPCPNYPTAPEFTVAIEVPRGDLASLAIGAGSTLALSDVSCDQ
jgi:uncharacterized membrane protein (UPF0127 family)